MASSKSVAPFGVENHIFGLGLLVILRIALKILLNLITVQKIVQIRPYYI